MYKKNKKTRAALISLIFSILLLFAVYCRDLMIIRIASESSSSPVIKPSKIKTSLLKAIEASKKITDTVAPSPSNLHLISANFKEEKKPSGPPEASEAPEAEPKDESIEKSISYDSGNVGITKKITIKNQTSYSVSPEEILKSEKPFSISGENPTVLILHTHGTEAYTPSERYNFTYTSNSRTTDTNYNVVRVGTELERALTDLGIGVIHDVSMYDYPDYNSSYDKAFYGIKAMLAKYPSISVVLDLHRDAVNTENGKKIKLAADIDGEKAAQIMFVVGTDECGFSHPHWRDNLKFASIIQGHLAESCPQLVRPINLRTSRFNQQFTRGSLIIEIGTNGNTLDEALLSAHYLADAVSKAISELK